eukprot:960141-Ditylum_brightwellii.AAC.1
MTSEEDALCTPTPTVAGATTDSTKDVEQVEEINDKFLPSVIDEIRDESMVAINGFQWKEGRLQLRYLLSTEETQWVDIQDTKVDHPRQTAQYIASHYKPRSGNVSGDR